MTWGPMLTGTNEEAKSGSRSDSKESDAIRQTKGIEMTVSESYGVAGSSKRLSLESEPLAAESMA